MEKETGKVNFSTAVCFFVILLLIIALAAVWYFGISAKNDKIKELETQILNLNNKTEEETQSNNLNKTNEQKSELDKNVTQEVSTKTETVKETKTETVTNSNEILKEWDILMAIEDKAIEAFGKYDISRMVNTIYAPEIDYNKISSYSITSSFYARPVWEETSSSAIYKVELTMKYDSNLNKDDKWVLTDYNISIVNEDQEIQKKWDILMAIENKAIEAFGKYDNSKSVDTIYAPKIYFNNISSNTINTSFYARPIWKETSSSEIYKVELTMKYDNNLNKDDKWVLSDYSIKAVQ